MGCGSAYRAAHACVAAALASNEYFSVIWARLGRDSRIAGAYLGIPLDTGRELQALFFDSDPSGGNQIGAVTGTSHCDALTDAGACALYDLQTGLCFACAGQRALESCSAD